MFSTSEKICFTCCFTLKTVKLSWLDKVPYIDLDCVTSPVLKKMFMLAVHYHCAIVHKQVWHSQTSLTS